MKVDIDKYILSEIYNLKFKVYYPLLKFVSKKEFLSITIKMELDKNVFFPIPIYLSLPNIKKNTKIIKIYYKKKYICNLNVNNIYKFTKPTKLKIGEKLFSTKDLNHPGYKKFLEDGNNFIDCKINNFKFHKNLINFHQPSKIKKYIIKNKITSLVGFHTRNVPHKSHEWIHKYGISCCKNLLIQPLIGQYRKGEYKEDIIIKLNKYIVKNIYKKKNVIFSIFNSFPRYAGPREACFHAIVRKNYGCTHFLVGRDHAGVGNYYNKYSSQKLSKKLESKLGIKIITFKEPVMCKNCNNIYSNKCEKCNFNKNIKISGSLIRKKIINKEKISSKFMHKSLSKFLNKNSIIN